MGLVETYEDQIQRLCKNYKVKTLYYFGSVTNRFTKDSEVDLMVDFETHDPIE